MTDHGTPYHAIDIEASLKIRFSYTKSEISDWSQCPLVCWEVLWFILNILKWATINGERRKIVHEKGKVQDLPQYWG